MSDGIRWAKIPGFVGYEASELGDIRHVGIYGTKILGQGTNVSGHKTVALRDYTAGKTKKFYVHRLVLMAFCGVPDTKMHACHYDDDPANNRLDNLRWGTAADNARDKARNHRHIKPSLLRPVAVDGTPQRRELSATRNHVAEQLAHIETQRANLIAQLDHLDTQLQVVPGASAA